MIVSAKGIYINFFMIIPFAALVRSATPLALPSNYRSCSQYDDKYHYR